MEEEDTKIVERRVFSRHLAHATQTRNTYVFYKAAKYRITEILKKPSSTLLSI